MPSDKRIYDYYIASRQSAALAAAVRVGLFDALQERALDAAGLADQLGLARRPVALLARVLLAMGLLVERERKLELAEDSAEFLVRGRPRWLGGLIDLEVDHGTQPAMLLDALGRDAPSVYGEADPWQAHAGDPERAAAFTAAMHSISSLPADSLARVMDLSTCARLLDEGGGSGAVSIAFAREYHQLECVVWDLPVVCEQAAKFAADADLSARVKTFAGDFHADDFPGGDGNPEYDVILFSQILHDWSPETGAELLRKARAALPHGGRVVIHEKLVGPDAPLANALVDLDMLVWTEGQQWTESGLRQALEAAGFSEIRCRPTTGYWSVVDALAL